MIHVASVNQGVVSKMWQIYPKGNVLTSDDQRAALVYVIELMIDQMLALPGMTRDLAFENVIASQIFIRSKSSIKLESGRVAVDLGKPISLLKHYLHIENQIKTLGDKKCRVGVIK